MQEHNRRNNTAIGNQALFLNTTGNDNTAIGNYALRTLIQQEHPTQQ
jgi:hypothetical protein